MPNQAMKKFLCIIGVHSPKIVRKVFWGNVHRAELRCTCGKRYEGFVAGPIGRVYPAENPSDFWTAYDAGALNPQRIISKNSP
jgi:hypothetical protein